MEVIGLIPRGDFVQAAEPEEYFTKDDASGARLFSVHVMQLGSFRLEDDLLFRDYLRANRDARDAYIDKKLSLMKQYSDQDYNSYGQGKIQFLEGLKVKAREWDKAG